MSSVRDDLAVEEAWAAELAERVAVIAPSVPVDVAGAVHRVRRRRRARRAAGSVSAVALVVLGGLAVQQVRTSAESTPPALSLPSLVRSTEDVDGREQVVVELDDSAESRAAAQARMDALVAAQVEMLANIDTQIAALPSGGEEAEAQRVALEGQRAGIQLRLDELETERDALLNADYAAWIAEQYGLTELPDVTVVAPVPSQDWAGRAADCLRDRGWDVRSQFQGGWQVQHDPEDERAFGTDWYACAVMYPADLGTPAAG